MRTAFINMAVMAIPMTWAPLSFGASATQTQKARPKVKVTFDRANFVVSYGKTLDLCMKIVPKAHFTPLIQFGSDPTGTITGSFGGQVTCPDSSYSNIQIASSISQCLASGSLVIKVGGKPVATLPGKILLPEKVYATLRTDAGHCDMGEYGALNKYFIHFASNDPEDGASANFDGIGVQEQLNTNGQPNGCEIPTAPLVWSKWNMGESPAPSNAIDDNNGQCSNLFTSCLTKINQSFKIGTLVGNVFTPGACPLSPVVVITVNIVNGGGTVSRTDEGGQ